jgi:hypothetical protein
MTDEDYWKPVIESDLTEEEHTIINEGMREYTEHPETFTLWEDVLKELEDKKHRENVLCYVEQDIN